MNEIVSPLQSTSYTNKDFVDIYTELLDLTKQLTSKWDPSISNESDPGVVLLKLNAVIADKNNYSIDKAILETFPLSVTQQENARKLFAQLGYYMHWYKSAYTYVSIKYTGEPISAKVNIPAFSMVSDNEDNVIYTLIGSSSVPEDVFQVAVDGQDLSLLGDNEITFKAIQGLPVNYQLNDSFVITVQDLDYQNRIYFDTNQIAENGIFITNVNSFNYNSWIKKDNLLIENLGNTYYKFGVSDDGLYCYLEFPEDVAELFNEGIKITYIRTDATYGDVSKDYLTKFYNNLTVSYKLENSTELKAITLDNTNTSIINTAASLGSSEEESINDAYRNYKRTVGTFDTLITLRDYINYIIENNLASNCVVCDRNNDIQTSYKVLTNNNEVDSIVTYHQTQVKTVKDINNQDVQINEDSMTAFDLKFYLLNYVNSDSIERSNLNYNNSFILLTNEELEVSKEYIKTSKTLNHNVSDILEYSTENPNICLFKNLYTISCKIIPQSILNDIQKNEINENIQKALRKGLNSNQLEFGEEPSYDLINTLTINADNRIKYVNLDNIDYTTYAIYYEKYILTYNESDNKWYDDHYNAVNPALLGLSASDPGDGAELSTYLYHEVDINSDPIEYYTNMKFSDGSYKLVYPNAIKIDENGLYDAQKSNDSLYTEIEYTYTSGSWSPSLPSYISILNNDYSADIAYSKGDRFSNIIETFKGNGTQTEFLLSTLSSSISYVRINGVDTSSYTTSTSNNRTKVIFTTAPSNNSKIEIKYTDGHSYTVLQDITASQNASFSGINNLGFIAQSDFSDGNKFKIRLSHAFQFSTDIYAKSVLAGKTELFVRDKKFDYNLDTYSTRVIDNIEKLEPNVDINFDFNDSNTSNIYTIRENEYLQIYYPNLIESNNYSNYVKYEYKINSDTPANTNYQLKSGEYIAFYYKNNTVDADELYIYHIYGKGSIINSTFSLPAQTSTVTIASQFGLLKPSNEAPEDSSTENNGAMSAECSATVGNLNRYLSGTSKITIKKLNELSFDSTSSYLFYWITNRVENNRYYLFDNDTDTEKVLEAGEYFFYSNKERTSYAVLGSGTLIKAIKNTGYENSNPTSKVITDYFDLMNGNQDMSGLFEGLPSYISLSCVENVFQTLGNGCKIKIDKSNNYFTQYFNGNGLQTRFLLKEPAYIIDHVWIGTQIDADLVDESKYCLITPSDEDDNYYIDFFNSEDAPPIGTNNLIVEYHIIPGSCTITFDRNGYTIHDTQEISTIYDTIDLSNFKISYKLPENSSTGSWTEIEPFELSNNKINGRTRLRISISPNKQQRLLYNQSLKCILNDSSEIDIEGADYTLFSSAAESITNPYCYPICLLSSMFLSSSMKDIYTSILDSQGNYEYLSLLQYKDLLNVPQDFSDNKQIEYNELSTLHVYPTDTVDVDHKTKSILISLSAGNYIIELSHNIESLDSLTCSYVPTGSSAIVLYNMQGTEYDFKQPGVYYLSLSSSSDISGTLKFDYTGVDKHSIIRIGNCYKYTNGHNDLTENRYNQIFDRMKYLDNKDIFKYIYDVPDNENIENPLLPKSFLNTNHIYNEFTICQMNTPSQISFG